VLLARAFLNRFARQQQRPVRDFTHEALEIIESYNWPGNVRELENRVKRAMIMADGTTISAIDLELKRMEAESQPFDLREVRDSAELRAIQRALNYTDNNVSRTADLLGVTRPTLYNLMKKYGLND
jgi:two-component system, NtrC family, response regulator